MKHQNVGKRFGIFLRVFVVFKIEVALVVLIDSDFIFAVHIVIAFGSVALYNVVGAGVADFFFERLSEFGVEVVLAVVLV